MYSKIVVTTCSYINEGKDEYLQEKSYTLTVTIWNKCMHCWPYAIYLFLWVGGVWLCNKFITMILWSWYWRNLGLFCLKMSPTSYNGVEWGNVFVVPFFSNSTKLLDIEINFHAITSYKYISTIKCSFAYLVHPDNVHNQSHNLVYLLVPFCLPNIYSLSWCTPKINTTKIHLYIV